jgi:hypothetical protein
MIVADLRFIEVHFVDNGARIYLRTDRIFAYSEIVYSDDNPSSSPKAKSNISFFITSGVDNIHVTETVDEISRMLDKLGCVVEDGGEYVLDEISGGLAKA